MRRRTRRGSEQQRDLDQFQDASDSYLLRPKADVVSAAQCGEASTVKPNNTERFDPFLDVNGTTTCCVPKLVQADAHCSDAATVNPHNDGKFDPFRDPNGTATCCEARSTCAGVGVCSPNLETVNPLSTFDQFRDPPNGSSCCEPKHPCRLASACKTDTLTYDPEQLFDQFDDPTGSSCCVLQFSCESVNVSSCDGFQKVVNAENVQSIRRSTWSVVLHCEEAMRYTRSMCR